MNHKGSSFISGCAATNDFIFFAKHLDELVSKDTPNSSFFCFDEEDAQDPFRKCDENVGWPAIAMSTTKPEGGIRTVVAVSAYGDFWEFEPQSTKETVGKLQKFRGHLRALSVIGEEIYACGMGRVVLKRQSVGKWESLGPSPKKDENEVVGFEDIDGFDSNEIYAVGWNGEIWWKDDKRWNSIKSPVSTHLRAVCCADDGQVYAVGDQGGMVTGRKDKWAVIDTGMNQNLKDVGFLEKRIYVVSDEKIFSLQKQKFFLVDDFVKKTDEPSTCLYLLSAPGGVFAMGPKDLLQKKPDVPWKRIV